MSEMQNTSYLPLKIEILIIKFTGPFYGVSLNCPPFAIF